jgi:hypothetical protein
MTRSPEYNAFIHSDEWRKKSKFFVFLTGRCALFPWKKATCSHHLHYKTPFGHESLIRDCVALSQIAHDIVHLDIFWNLKGNSQTPSKLRPWVSNYLRAIAIFLVILNPFIRILGWFWRQVK